MEMLSLTLGPVSSNCYILTNDFGETLIFDPGDEPERIISLIEDNGLKPIAVVLTHAHFDHIGALDLIRDHFKIEAWQNPIEKDFITDPVLNRSDNNGLRYVSRPVEHYFDTEKELTIDHFKMTLATIPGHSPGSTVFFFDDENFAIVGDVIFKGSVGRSDLPGGSHQTLMAGIREHIMRRPDDYILFPGHGGPTTVGHEDDTNPFLNQGL